MKNYSATFFLLALLPLLLIKNDAIAEVPHPVSDFPNTPQGVVEGYCETMYRYGYFARSMRREEAWRLVEPYMLAEREHHDFGGLDITIVDKYEVVQRVQEDESTYSILVRFHILGNYYFRESEAGPFSETFPIIETVPFLVRLSDGEWKIDYPRGLMPHMSAERMLALLREQKKKDLAHILEDNLRKFSAAGR